MANVLRALVSKKKYRYKDKHFDLDLTYVTENIIAMGFPSSNYEQLYRNPMEEVKRFLETRHADQYKVWNLCVERHYDQKHFHGRVEEAFAFFDHNAPTWDMIIPFCLSVDEWLKSGKDRVVVIHCKAGKGRTGTLICCYLLWSGMCSTAQDALDFYGRQRTKNSKGVTIPSQMRYVRYLERVLFDHRKKTKNTGEYGSLNQRVSASHVQSNGDNIVDENNGDDDEDEIDDGDGHVDDEDNGDYGQSEERECNHVNVDIEARSDSNGSGGSDDDKMENHSQEYPENGNDIKLDVKDDLNRTVERMEELLQLEQSENNTTSQDSIIIYDNQTLDERSPAVNDVSSDSSTVSAADPSDTDDLEVRQEIFISHLLQPALSSNDFSTSHPGQELVLTRIFITPVPAKGISNPSFTICDSSLNILYKAGNMQDYGADLCIGFKCHVLLRKDILFTFYKQKGKEKQKKICAFWINTEFIDDNHVVFAKKDLDKAVRDVNKDKSFSEDFCVEVFFSSEQGLRS